MSKKSKYIHGGVTPLAFAGLFGCMLYNLRSFDIGAVVYIAIAIQAVLFVSLTVVPCILSKGESRVRMQQFKSKFHLTLGIIITVATIISAVRLPKELWSDDVKYLRSESDVIHEFAKETEFYSTFKDALNNTEYLPYSILMPLTTGFRTVGMAYDLSVLLTQYADTGNADGWEFTLQPPAEYTGDDSILKEYYDIFSCSEDMFIEYLETKDETLIDEYSDKLYSFADNIGVYSKKAGYSIMVVIILTSTTLDFLFRVIYLLIAHKPFLRKKENQQDELLGESQ